jgi:hypothetical protein
MIFKPLKLKKMKPYIIISTGGLFFYKLLTAKKNNYFLIYSLVRSNILNTIIAMILSGLFLTSCAKENIEPNNETAPSTSKDVSAVKTNVTAGLSAPLDALDIVDIHLSNGILYGNVNSIGPYNFTPIAKDLLPPYNGLRIVLNNNQPGQIGYDLTFVKGGYLPNSKNPFYYMKVSDKYLLFGLIGVYLDNATTQNEAFREWVFTKGPVIAGAPGATYYIHNVGFSHSSAFSLQVSHDTNSNEDYIGGRSQDQTTGINIRQQVFCIKSPLSVPPNTK